VLRQALNWTLELDLVARNAAARAKAPEVPRYEIQPLDDTEARGFLAAAKGTRFEALYVIALYLGMRRGEILGLRWQVLDLDRGTLLVNQAIQRVTGKLRAAEPKTKKSRRTLTLPASVVDSLRAHRTRQIEQRLQAGPSWQDLGLVFATRIGTAIEPRNLLRNYEQILARAEVRRVRFHDLRHSAASMLLSEGVELRLIQEILGHSSISVTADLYAHIAPKMMRQAAATMQSILG